MTLDDLFNSATGLGKLGIVGILALAAMLFPVAFIRRWIVPGSTAERYLAGWEAATKQFERALDVIDRMQNRRRANDESHR